MLLALRKRKNINDVSTKKETEMPRGQTTKTLFLGDLWGNDKKRKSLTYFQKWVLISENVMFMSPILLAVSLDMNTFVFLFMAVSIAAILYGLRFYKHVHRLRQSALFWKRSRMFGRCFGFWLLFLFSLFAVGLNNVSKMRKEKSFESNQSTRGQEDIKVGNWRQGKENNAA